MQDNRPIGVFDSGIGGLTVLREIWAACPGESTVYFGDNSRAPYGTKSKSTVIRYSLQNLKFLESKNVKMIVVACNTASAYAYEALKAAADVPVVEVVTPGAAAACRATHNGRIGIIATNATVSTGVYKTAVESAAESLGLGSLEITQKACPLFVSLAEEGWWDTEVTKLTAEEYLKPLKDAGVDTLVLGCTHYPLLANVIQKVMGESVKLVNTGVATAQTVRNVLESMDIRAQGCDSAKEFYTSDEPEMFEAVASPFLGSGLPAGTRHFSTDRYEVNG
ncbi:MAG: glutamate racemase [Mageeibacillus sp.]|jgi:glutamate racemase|nr:glutamate racemase [Mageeibacillus sp.]MCI1264726.1 glutamate racemase [Saccharofermentans sp.]MCI1770058.1 glutamate racemase [Mageeibacillus sp.]MCI2043879.1 glutamate racemase [Mageeibacillus sp.]